MGKKRLDTTRGITKVSQTSFQLEFSYKSETWRPRIKVSNTDDSRDIQYANNYYAEIIRKISRNEFDPTKEFPDYKKTKHIVKTIVENTLTVEKILDLYLYNPIVQVHYKHSTLKLDRRKAKNVLIPAIGKIDANTLTCKQVKTALVDNRGRDVTKKTINNDISILRRAFKWYKGEDETFDNNIFINWTPLAKKPNGKPKINPFTHEEVKQILLACSLAYANEPARAIQLRNIITVMYWQGLRISECFGLHWEDIDFDNEKIHIRGAMVEGHMQSDAKTQAGNRVIDMIGETKNVLLNQRAYTYFLKDFVFLNPTNNKPFMSTTYFSVQWNKIIKQTEIKHRPPKQLRHSWATYALAAGEDVQWVAGHLGHTNFTFTASVYYRFMRNLYPNAGKAMEKLREFISEEEQQ